MRVLACAPSDYRGGGDRLVKEEGEKRGRRLLVEEKTIGRAGVSELVDETSRDIRGGPIVIILFI